MAQVGFTKEERSLAGLMYLWSIVFLAVAALFAIIPNYITNSISDVGLKLIGWDKPQIADGNPFWVVLAVALLLILSYMCAIVRKNPLQNLGYTRPVILAKFVSSLGFLICFFASGRSFLYFVATIVDGSICVITWRFYKAALKSRPR